MRSRLRTLPFLPPHKRPDVITSKSGKEIVVNKVKVEDKEKILKRGQVSSLSPLFSIKVRGKSWEHWTDDR
jgi:hypothetical protein